MADDAHELESDAAATALEEWDGELDAQGLRAYVLGSLAYRGGTHPDLTVRVQRALQWYRALSMRGGVRGVLFSWVYDIGHLLTEGERFNFSSLISLSAWPEEERGVRLEYENRLLNGMLRDPSTRRAIEFIRQDPTRNDLIARTIGLLLEPLVRAGGHAGAPVVDPVLLRELAVHGQLDLESQVLHYEQLLAEEGALFQALGSSLERFFQNRGARPALGADDLAEIEHWSAFKKAAQRLAGRRIAARSAMFPRVDPSGVAVAEEEETDTELPDSGYYPQGGFAELATRGPIENLVPTELVYMGEDPFGDEPNPPIDLFDLRVLESEALFFARDSGQLRRTRRTVHLAVAPDEGLRLKLKWHKDPLAVLVYGLFVRLSEDLGQIFPTDALRLELHVLCGSGVARERAEEDRELLRVLLRHEIARGAAEVFVQGGDIDLRALGERDRRVYGIAVQSGDRPPAGLPTAAAPPLKDGAREPRLIVWKIGGSEPGPDEPSVVYMPVEGAPDASLVMARNAILNEIAGVKGKGVGSAAILRPRKASKRRLPRGLRRGRQSGEFVNTRDGSTLVWVPPGAYRLGSEESDPERNLDQPPHLQRLHSGFYMSKHPVTWAQYRRFCTETGCKPPKPLFDAGDGEPVHRVAFEEAQAYASWAGLRLPAELEWECAARGTDARPFPWGEEEPLDAEGPRCTCGRDADGSEGWTTPGGTHARFASPFGCEDMSGNVWEWVVAQEPPGTKGHVARGGSWNTPPWDCRLFTRARYSGRSQYVGFRLARSGA